MMRTRRAALAALLAILLIVPLVFVLKKPTIDKSATLDAAH